MDRLRRDNRVREIGGNYFQHRAWQLVAILERLSGFWPYQSKIQQMCLRTWHFSVFSSIILASVNAFVKLVGTDLDLAIDSLLTIVLILCLQIELMHSSIYRSNRRKTYEIIAEHFEKMNDTEEAAILRKCADQGFRYTAIYVCIICACFTVFDSAPNVKLLYSYFFSDGDLKMVIPLPMDFGFDHRDYWYVICLDFLAWSFSGVLVNVVYDMSFIMQVRHAQALLEVVRTRLTRASRLADELESRDAVDRSYLMISSAIDLHSECLRFIDAIEETYALGWFVVLLLNSAFLGAFVHLISVKLSDPIEMFRYGCAFVMCTLHFLAIFYHGQIIIDSSSTISEVCYNCSWYNLPKKSSKLLSVMMMRASAPVVLTGAKLFPMSMESFCKMLKASLSYYTVFEN